MVDSQPFKEEKQFSGFIHENKNMRKFVGNSTLACSTLLFLPAFFGKIKASARRMQAIARRAREKAWRVIHTHSGVYLCACFLACKSPLTLFFTPALCFVFACPKIHRNWRLSRRLIKFWYLINKISVNVKEIIGFWPALLSRSLRFWNMASDPISYPEFREAAG